MSNCKLCDVGFPLDGKGNHLPTQSLGMIPVTRCENAPPVETAPCELCGRTITITDTKLCYRCWELDRRIKADPALAYKILAATLRPVTRVKQSAKIYSRKKMKKVLLRY